MSNKKYGATYFTDEGEKFMEKEPDGDVALFKVKMEQEIADTVDENIRNEMQAEGVTFQKENLSNDAEEVN